MPDLLFCLRPDTILTRQLVPQVGYGQKKSNKFRILLYIPDFRVL